MVAKNRFRLLLLAVLAFRALLAHAAPDKHGLAPVSLERVLILKDGSIYRGEVLELVPREYIILKLRNGTDRRFSWASIDRQSTPGSDSVSKESPTIEQPHVPAQIPEPIPPPKKRVQSAPPNQDETIRPAPSVSDVQPASRDRVEPDAFQTAPNVHQIPSPSNIKLPPDLQRYKTEFVFLTMRSSVDNLRLEYLKERKQIEGYEAFAGYGAPTSISSWRHACDYPCGEYVYRKAVFRVKAEGMMNSSEFTLPRSGSEMELRVKPGRPIVRGFGIAFDVIGPVSLLAGGLLLLNWQANLGSMATAEQANDFLDAGILALGIGTGATILGIVWTVRGRTTVTLSRHPQSVPAPQLPATEVPEVID